MTKKYPQHEKIKALGERRNTVQEFLDWLDEQGIRLAESAGTGELCCIGDSKEKVMARFFGIDLNKLELEKRAMLDSLRER